jgi:hypothetical protein
MIPFTVFLQRGIIYKLETPVVLLDPIRVITNCGNGDCV